MSFRYDRAPISSYEKLPDGRLRVKATFSRVGPLRYLRADGSIQTEILSDEELFRTDSLDTAGLAPVTLGHPPEGEVTPKTWKKYAVGASGSTIVARQDAGLVDVVFVIGDEEAISAVEKRDATQVSAGYRTQVEQRADGKFYQTNRIYNHLALVPLGRAGSTVSLHLDGAQEDWAVQCDEEIVIEIENESEEEDPMNTDMGCGGAISKVSKNKGDNSMAMYKGMEMSEDAVAAFKGMEGEMAQMKKDMNSMKQKKDEALESQLTQVTAERDVAVAKVDSLEKELSTRMDAAAVESAAQELAIAKQTAFDSAKSFLGEDVKFDATLSPLDWKRKVLEVQGVKLDGKTDEYISAAAEMVMVLGAKTKNDEAARKQEYKATMDAAQVGGDRGGSSVVSTDEDFDAQIRKDAEEATAAYCWKGDK